MTAAIIAHWVFQPLHGLGYQLWSGIGSDLQEVELPVAMIVGAITAWRIYRNLRPHLECHEETCHRIGLHHVVGTPYRTCWPHHPVLSKHPGGEVPLMHIHQAHAAANTPDPPEVS